MIYQLSPHENKYMASTKRINHISQWYDLKSNQCKSINADADDHLPYIRGNSVEHAEQSLNNEGQTISTRYRDNSLKEKYKVMSVMNSGNNSDLFVNVNIDGHTIKSTPATTIYVSVPNYLFLAIYFWYFNKVIVCIYDNNGKR